MTRCDVCGDELSWEDYTIIAETLALKLPEGYEELSEHPEYKKLKKTFGKTEFNICYTCKLKSLGVKPKNWSPVDEILKSTFK